MARQPAGGGLALGDLYSKCVQMVNENKISTKNAFDLPLIDHIDDIVDSFMGGPKGKKGPSSSGRASSSGGGMAVGSEDENRFHEASCTIEASARIYACRVDCVHTDTYRVLGGLSSADPDEEEGGAEEGGGGQRKRRRICGVNTLEKNEANIIQQNLEADEQSDPTFRRMAAAFDAGGAKGLLLGHLPLAEDLSLVFNGDVPLCRAEADAQPLFAQSQYYPRSELGYGTDTQAACSRIASSRLCIEVEGFRHQLLESSTAGAKMLPDRIEELFGQIGVLGATTVVGAPKVPIANGPNDAPPPLPQPIGDAMEMGPPEDLGGDLPDAGFDDLPQPSSPPRVGVAPGFDVEQAQPSLPFMEGEGAIVPHAGQSSEDVIAFDELFQKFCGTGSGAHQFAYFDECWSKLAKDKDGKVPIEDAAQGGALVAAGGEVEKKEKTSKRPLFDLAALDKPPRPIETEPAHKHRLSERAAHWQLHKDVPPYMIDRITMPSWPTWSKCDFACLGLRPHLMLKLVKKPAPDTAGPHSFADLFSTVVVENPEAFPWLAMEARGSAVGAARVDDDDRPRADRDLDGDDLGNEEFDGGLPAHLDVDPQDLFLRPDDRVLPGGDQDDLADLAADDPSGFVPGMGDFDLVDQPQTVGNTDIGYSRNSKFVDVKLVKKHLWDVISEDISEAKKDEQQSLSSFQSCVNRTVKRMPKGETENLSVAVCFICALHLCNEKGIELNTEKELPLGDFKVAGPKP